MKSAYDEGPLRDQRYQARDIIFVFKGKCLKTCK